MKLSIEKFKKYVDDEFSLAQLEALADVIEDRLVILKTAIDKANHKTIKGFSINEAEDFIYESLRDWFKKEKWVRISSSGNIAGPCGTSKNKKNPDRCLPRAKAQSLTKAQRAATAAKKKKAGAKGKTVVKNTKKATVKKEGFFADLKKHNRIRKIKKDINKAAGSPTPQAIYSAAAKFYKKFKEEGDELGMQVAKKDLDLFKNKIEKQYQINTDEANNNMKKLTVKKETKGAPKGHYFTASGNLVKGRLTKDARERGARLSDPKDKQRSKVPPVTQYKEDIRNLVVGLLHEYQQKEDVLQEDDRCTRIAKQKYDTWPSAYASGAVVRCRRGEIWKKK